MSENKYLNYVVEAVSEVTRQPTDTIDINASLHELDLDSLDSVEILMVMDDKTGVETDANILDGCNSIKELADRYAEHLESKKT